MKSLKLLKRKYFQILVSRNSNNCFSKIIYYIRVHDLTHQKYNSKNTEMECFKNTRIRKINCHVSGFEKSLAQLHDN